MLTVYQLLCIPFWKPKYSTKWPPPLKTKTAPFKPAHLANVKAVEVYQLIPLAAPTAAALCLQPHVHQQVMCV